MDFTNYLTLRSSNLATLKTVNLNLSTLTGSTLNVTSDITSPNATLTVSTISAGASAFTNSVSIAGGLTTSAGYATNLNGIIRTNLVSLGYTAADFSTAGVVGFYTGSLGTITNPSAGVYQVAQTAAGRSVMRIPAFGTGTVLTTYYFSFNIKCTVGTATISVEQSGTLKSPALYQLTTGFNTVTGSFIVDGTSNSPVFVIYTGTASWNAQWDSFTLSTYGASVSSSLGIGTTSPSYPLHVIGAIYASGNITALSDERHKQDIIRLGHSLDTIRNINGYYFSRTDYQPGIRQIGLLAQEVNKVIPEAVSYDAVNDTYSLNYGCLIAPVIEAMKEINEKVDSKIGELEAKINAQQVLIQQLMERAP